MDFKSKIKNSITLEEQRIFVKFSVLQGHSGGIIHSDLVKLLGKEALAKSTVEKWVTKLRKGETDMEGAQGGDRTDPEIINQRIELIKECFSESRHWSLRSLASHTSIPYHSVQRIIKHVLGMRKILGK